MHYNQGPNPQLEYVPWSGIEPTTFWSMEQWTGKSAQFLIPLRTVLLWSLAQAGSSAISYLLPQMQMWSYQSITSSLGSRKNPKFSAYHPQFSPSAPAPSLHQPDRMVQLVSMNWHGFCPMVLYYQPPLPGISLSPLCLWTPHSLRPFLGSLLIFPDGGAVSLEFPEHSVLAECWHSPHCLTIMCLIFQMSFLAL